MKAQLFFIFLFASSSICRSEDIQFEHTYSWGSVHLSAKSTEKRASSSLLEFRTDVLADFRFTDGRCLLVAAGHLELNPATGEFIADDRPFYIVKIEEKIMRYDDGVPTSFHHFPEGRIQSQAGLFLLNVPRPLAIIHLRRQQLATLEKRW